MRSNQKTDTLMQDRRSQFDESSRNARPDHTLRVKSSAASQTTQGGLRRRDTMGPQPRRFTSR